MPSKITTLNATWTAVASGTGNVTFQPVDHPAEWAIHNSASNVGLIGGFKAEVGIQKPLFLAAGEYLHLRGRGNALIAADTLV